MYIFRPNLSVLISSSLFLSGFPIEPCWEIIKSILKLFPALPRCFQVVEDLFGRPQFRWYCEFRARKLYYLVSEPIELRISFKSVSFIRVSIEVLYGCTHEQKHDSCTPYPAFPMYLDLEQAAAVSRLYDVILYFLRSMEPIGENVRRFSSGFINGVKSQEEATQSLDRQLTRHAESIVAAFNLPAHGHDSEFIKRTLQGLPVREKKFPRTNLVAVIRALRREVNQLACKMSPDGLLDAPRSIYELLSEYEIVKAEISKRQGSVPPPARGWPSHALLVQARNQY